MKMTKEQKQEVRDQYAKVWHKDSKMTDYCTDKTSGFVMLGGTMVTFDKPSIQTDFWFGEHTYDYDEVCDRARAASKSEAYFMARNLDDIDWRLKAIDDPCYKKYVAPRGYSNQDADCILGFVEFDRSWDGPRSKGAREMTDEERGQYREFIQGEREKFEKRLRTYLKRYGLSKCHYGVFWADR